MSDAEDALRAIYEEVMWLAKRPNVSPGNARAWYTHVRADQIKRQVRFFSGRVSRAAVEAPEGQRLVLEHYGRMQASISSLVERHLREQTNDPREFIQAIIDQEKVHIVTEVENQQLQNRGGDYSALHIVLVDWANIAAHRQQQLWQSKLRGHVSNSGQYKPNTAQT